MSHRTLYHHRVALAKCIGFQRWTGKTTQLWKLQPVIELITGLAEQRKLSSHLRTFALVSYIPGLFVQLPSISFLRPFAGSDLMLLEYHPQSHDFRQIERTNP